MKAHKSTALAQARARDPATPASRAPPSARSRAWPRPVSATTCCWPTRSLDAAPPRAPPPTPTAPRHRRRRLATATIDAAAARRRARGAHRRQRRPAPLRLRPRGRRAPRRPGPRRRASTVRGVMGYEGHVVGLADRAERGEKVERGDGAAAARRTTTSAATSCLGRRHRHLRHQHVGHRDPGRLVRADGHRLRRARAAVPPGAARCGHRDLASTRRAGPWPTAGLKALGMDHGNPTPRRRRRRVVLLRRARHVRARRRPAGAGRRPRPRASPPTSTRPSPTTSASTSSATATTSSTCGPSTSAAGDVWRQGSPGRRALPPERVGEGAEGAAAVGDGVLLVRRHLGERAAVALVGDEHRVVAEARRRRGGASAIVPSTSPSATTSRPSGQRASATVRKRAVRGRRHAVELGEQLGARCRRRSRPRPA